VFFSSRQRPESAGPRARTIARQHPDPRRINQLTGRRIQRQGQAVRSNRPATNYVHGAPPRTSRRAFLFF
jgi:hypothetical protein